MVKELEKEDGIDRSYYDKLVNEAVETISQYGDFEWFVSDDPYISELGANDADVDSAPWETEWENPCGDKEIRGCLDCPHYKMENNHIECDKGFDILDTVMKMAINQPENN